MQLEKKENLKMLTREFIIAACLISASLTTDSQQIFSLITPKITLINCLLYSKGCGTTERNEIFNRVRGVELNQVAIKGSLITAINMNTQEKCATECTLECRCFIFVFLANLCSMYNITAKDYVVPNPQVSSEVAFFYKASFINNGPLFLLDRKTSHYLTNLSGRY